MASLNPNSHLKYPKNLITLLLLTSSLSHLQGAVVHEILATSEFETHSQPLVKREAPGGSQNDPVSELAFVTRLNSSHLHMMVHWAGQGLPTVIVLARSQVMKPGATSKLYISNDFGKSFQEKSHLFKLNNGQNATIEKLYNHHQSTCHYVFTDTINGYVFTSSNCGKDITPHKLENITPSLISFDKNNDNVFLIHDLDSPEKKLYVTKNFGVTISHVQDYVRNFFFDQSGGKLYVERMQPGSLDQVHILASTNFFERHIDTEIVYRDAVQFQLVNQFMFATKRRSEDHLDLYISQHGERFVQAQFPYAEDKNFTHHDYHIIDVTDDGQIMVVVNHGPILSNLYVSSRITPYEVYFSLSLERVMFYNPNVTWHDTWLAHTAQDKPFADVYKVQGLRGIYIASQIVNGEDSNLRNIEPANLKSLITFDQGAIWTPIKGPKTDEEGRNFTECLGDLSYRCNLHLSQQLSQKFPSTRSIPILSSSSAIGIVMGSGSMGKTLMQKTNVLVSADAGLSWHQVLKGSYFYNMGDHGGILVATKYYKTEGPTNELLYSTNEGIDWKVLKFYPTPIKVYGLLTEPGENSTTFTVFGSEESQRGLDWLIVTIDLTSVFAKNCSLEDYKRWSPNDSSRGKHRNCLLGRKEVYERRMVHANCHNGRDYQRLLSVESCACDKSDYQCDFGFKLDDSWSNGCVQDEKYHHDPYEPPANCPAGQFYNLTRGYVKIRGDSCEAGNAKQFEPQLVPCPVQEEKEFLLLSTRDQILRINLKDLTQQDILPLENDLLGGEDSRPDIISLEFQMLNDTGCLFYGEVNQRKIFKQCLDGSRAEVLVKGAETVEAMSYDWISKTLYFVDGSRKTIEVVRVDIKHEGRMKRTILDQHKLTKPRGIAVHPLHGYLFYSDWNEAMPHIARADMDGSNVQILFRKPLVHWPNLLSLDYVANRLYWTDAKKDSISSCRYDGTDYKVVMERSSSLHHPFGLTVHKNLIFYDDWTNHALYMADKNSGKGVAVIKDNLVGAMDVKAFSYLHRQGRNPCSDEPCSHLCVPLPNENFACLCPDGLRAVNGTEGKIVCKCPDGSDDLGNGTCPMQGGTCSSNQFTCANGACIPEGWVCDGNNDCGDHSDETDFKCNKLECRPNEWMCADGEKCISEKWRCDFDKDCRDGSDEECTHTTCREDEFRCNNGQCISNKWFCDLENDCNDGSDEDNCRERNLPNADQQECKATEFKCANSPQCFPKSWQCDGDFDCPGQDDEENCEAKTCQDWQFDCGAGHCIFKNWQCDGEVDCPNGNLDEQNCTDTGKEGTEYSTDEIFPIPTFPNASQCNEWSFKCNNGQCIPYWWKCDGSKDCSDHSDESECDPETTPKEIDNDNHETDPTWVPECAKDKFLCPGSAECIWEAWLCDEENDCPGGEDESEEICRHRPICNKNMFRCEQSGQCIGYEQVCDHHVDCSDGSDEIGCQADTFSVSCPINQILCDESKCITDDKVCDGINDCIDATDEIGCPVDHPQVLGLEIVGDSINATSVQVDWYLPDPSHSNDLEYQPGYAFEGTQDWKWQPWQKIPDRSYTFSNLRPFTTYKFRVNLKTSEGVVYNSTKQAKTTTSPAMPTKPSLYDVAQTSSNLVLKWTQPASTNGPLKNYIIEITDQDAYGASSRTFRETEGPVESFTLELSQFHPGQNLTFRVRAVNSLFKGEFSNPVQLSVTHSVLQDSIDELKATLVTDTSASFEWNRVVAQDTNSRLNKDRDWYYRVSYSILDNQFAAYQDHQILDQTQADSEKVKLEIRDLSPGTEYTFRFQIQSGNLTGPATLKRVTTAGKSLPRPEIREVSVVPTAGTSIKLTWNLPEDAKTNSQYVYAVYYGMNVREMISNGPRLNTTETTVRVSGLHACESYSFVVLILGPKGYGPPSAPFTRSTKFAAGAPPKNLVAKVNSENNSIHLSWTSSCSVMDQPMGYKITCVDKTSGARAYTAISKTVKTELIHVFDDKIKYGTEYEFSVQTDVQNALASNLVSVKTMPLPQPEALVTFPDVESSSHHIKWNAPKSLPNYLQREKDANKLSYRLLVSPDVHLKSTPELTFNLSATTFQLPMDKLEPGKLYYVGVALVDEGLYVSEPSGPIPLESPIPDKDLVVSPTGVAGVLVPIFIVIAVLGSALGYYVYRNRRLKRNFIAFASRYSPATGAAILNAASLDDEDDDSPIIRGFADDEPLVVS